MRLRLTRAEAAISVFDAALGTLIGVGSLGWILATSPMSEGRRVDVVLSSAEFDLMLLGAPMFLGTLVLALPFLRLLRRWSGASPIRYYAMSAAAGVAFGVAASVATGALFGLVVPFLPGPEESSLGDRIALLFGAPYLFGLTAGFVALTLQPQLVLGGVGFGLLNGWLVRRLRPATAALALLVVLGAPGCDLFGPEAAAPLAGLQVLEAPWPPDQPAVRSSGARAFLVRAAGEPPAETRARPPASGAPRPAETRPGRPT